MPIFGVPGKIMVKIMVNDGYDMVFIWFLYGFYDGE